MWTSLRLLAISFLSLRREREHEYTAKRNGYGYGEIKTFSSCRVPFSLNANRKESQDIDAVLRIQLEERKKRSRKEYLQEKLGMENGEVERLIRGNPSILDCRSEENMGPTIDWLQHRLKLDQKGIKKIVFARNRLLGSSTETIDYNISWLQKRFNITDDQIGQIVLKNPSLLDVSIEKCLQPNIKLLQTHLEMDDKAIQKLVFKLPYICMTNFCAKVSWLQERLDLSNTEAIGRLLNGVDATLNLSIETLDARICWFETEFYLPFDKVAKLILKCPRVLGLQSSLLTNKKKWLQKRLKLSDEEVGKLVYSQPSLLTSDMEATLEPNLCWLQSRLRLDDAGLCKLLCSQPQIMYLSTENNLAPKINFLTEVLGEEGTRLLISKNPPTLTRSLENRIKPRVAEALELGMLLDAKSLGSIIGYTEEAWEERKLRFRLRQGC